MQTDTQTQLCSASFPLPFALTSVCCKQELLLRTGLPFTLIHSTRSSHSMLSSFLFPHCLFVHHGTAEVVPGAQLGTRDRPKKKPEQLLQAELHLAGIAAAAPGTDGPAGLQKLSLLSKLRHGFAPSCAGSRKPLATYCLFWLL